MFQIKLFIPCAQCSCRFNSFDWLKVHITHTLQNRKHRIYTIGKAPNKEKINRRKKHEHVAYWLIQTNDYIVSNPSKNIFVKMEIFALHLSVFFFTFILSFIYELPKLVFFCPNWWMWFFVLFYLENGTFISSRFNMFIYCKILEHIYVGCNIFVIYPSRRIEWFLFLC